MEMISSKKRKKNSSNKNQNLLETLKAKVTCHMRMCLILKEKMYQNHKGREGDQQTGKK